jgi:hypothetical protein
MPADRLDDAAAHHRPEGAAQGSDAAPDTDRPAVPFGRVGLDDQGERQRHHDRGAEPLQRARRDQDAHVRRCAGHE